MNIKLSVQKQIQPTMINFIKASREHRIFRSVENSDVDSSQQETEVTLICCSQES